MPGAREPHERASPAPQAAPRARSTRAGARSHLVTSDAACRSPRGASTVSSPPRCSRNSLEAASTTGRPSGPACASDVVPAAEARGARAGRRCAQRSPSASRPASDGVAGCRAPCRWRPPRRGGALAGQRLELVRRPVAEVERPRAAAARTDRRRSRCAAGAARRSAGSASPARAGSKAASASASRLEPLEERGVADQRHLDRLGHAGEAVARRAASRGSARR